jgi:hypothetical protein
MIDRATLLKIARDTASQRMAARPTIRSAYLTGSVAANEAMLGEATDIDLIFIDANPPPVTREVIRLTDQVALDIQHRHTAEYAQPKLLRVHPWRGPELCEPYFVSDPTHFFELAQASARGQFHRPDFVTERARAFLELARGELHVGLLPGSEPSEPVTFAALSRALLYAANAVISLTAFPGAGRRLVLKLEAAAQKLKRPDVSGNFIALFEGNITDHLANWSAAYRAGQSLTDELIHPARRTIYERGFAAQAQADRAADGLWLMLFTWQALMKNIPTDSPQADAWITFLEALDLASPTGLAQKVSDAHDYLDLAVQVVDSWAEQNGA